MLYRVAVCSLPFSRCPGCDYLEWKDCLASNDGYCYDCRPAEETK